ncbi:unnamed protein product [Protopolystoma xenopodis]|uniref:Uncharacterized protein n=1 Tax=Protopolystoma xenopodis TaxID=117903 RepID=A0A3S5CSR7_9PLAT|nr:unnamed protein product [Protopolystoma xenopodis]
MRRDSVPTTIRRNEFNGIQAHGPIIGNYPSNIKAQVQVRCIETERLETNEDGEDEDKQYFETDANLRGGVMTSTSPVNGPALGLVNIDAATITALSFNHSTYDVGSCLSLLAQTATGSVGWASSCRSLSEVMDPAGGEEEEDDEEDHDAQDEDEDNVKYEETKGVNERRRLVSSSCITDTNNSLKANEVNRPSLSGILRPNGGSRSDDEELHNTSAARRRQQNVGRLGALGPLHRQSLGLSMGTSDEEQDDEQEEEEDEVHTEIRKNLSAKAGNAASEGGARKGLSTQLHYCHHPSHQHGLGTNRSAGQPSRTGDSDVESAATTGPYPKPGQRGLTNRCPTKTPGPVSASQSIDEAIDRLAGAGQITSIDRQAIATIAAATGLTGALNTVVKSGGAGGLRRGKTRQEIRKTQTLPRSIPAPGIQGKKRTVSDYFPQIITSRFRGLVSCSLAYNALF